MVKKMVMIALCAIVLSTSIWAQNQEQVVTPFTDAGGMFGLIFEATGYGLVVGAGVASSSRDTLGLALTFFAIAPLASTTGAWLFTGFMERTTNFWVKNGVPFDGTKYIQTSRTYAFVTTGAAIASILTGLLIPDSTGAIISIVCSGISVCSDIIALYGVRLAWNQAINKAIVSSGVDWKAIKAGASK